MVSGLLGIINFWIVGGDPFTGGGSFLGARGPFLGVRGGNWDNWSRFSAGGGFGGDKSSFFLVSIFGGLVFFSFPEVGVDDPPLGCL